MQYCFLSFQRRTKWIISIINFKVAKSNNSKGTYVRVCVCYGFRNNTLGCIGLANVAAPGQCSRLIPTENKFSGVFRGYKMRTLTRNGLISSKLNSNRVNLPNIAYRLLHVRQDFFKSNDFTVFLVLKNLKKTLLWTLAFIGSKSKSYEGNSEKFR